MQHWRSIIVLALVFLAGAAVGAFAVRTAVRAEVNQAQTHPEKSQVFLERNFVHRLELDEHQQARLHEILSDSRRQLDQLHHTIQPRVNAVLRTTDDNIAALLTPEQLVRYEHLKRQNHPFWRLLQGPPKKSGTRAEPAIPPAAPRP